jgi:hypothetical protein
MQHAIPIDQVDDVEENPIHIIHEGEDYTIQEKNDRLLLKWKAGRFPDYETRRRAENLISGILNGNAVDDVHLNERDEWYELRLRTMHDLAELMQEDARARRTDSFQKGINFLTFLLFVVPTIRLQLTLGQADLSGGELAVSTVIGGVQSLRFQFPGELPVVEVYVVTDNLGVVRFNFWPGHSFPLPLSRVMNLHGDPTVVPSCTSLKYLTMRQIAADILARPEDSDFLHTVLKRVWRDFYLGPVPPRVGEKRPRPDAEEDEGPPRKMSRVNERE